MSVGFGWTVRNGVGSRFRATINRMESGLPENDSRPLPRWRDTDSVKRGHERISGMTSQPFDDHVDRYDEWFERNRAVHESEVRAAASLLPRHDLEIEIRERFGGHRGAVALAVSILVDVNALAGIEVMTKWQ
jgi:hypothetical protein